MEYKQYSIGKPGIDGNRRWDDMKATLRRSEVEKIELASGAPIPLERIEKAREETAAITDSD